MLSLVVAWEVFNEVGMDWIQIKELNEDGRMKKFELVQIFY